MRTARISPIFGALRELETPTTATVLNYFTLWDPLPVPEEMLMVPWDFGEPHIGDRRFPTPKERAKAKAKRKARRKARRNQRSRL